MVVTAQDINKLRQLTGAGILDCKKVLTEAQGDFEQAIDLLRKRGQKLSAARAGRATTEGLVMAGVDKAYGHGAIIALSCETDFVAKNENFQHLASAILQAALTHQPATIEELTKLPLEGLTIQERITELLGKMGEKLTLTAYETISDELVIPYTHTGSKLGVLVGLRGGGTSEKFIEVGKDVAMQIAAMKPIAIDKNRVDQAVVERELNIAKEQVMNEGKPADMVEKIAQGKLNKFFKENTLLSQSFVKDNSLTVAQYLEQVAKGLNVSAFKRVTIDR